MAECRLWLQVGEVKHVNCYMGSPLASLFEDPKVTPPPPTSIRQEPRTKNDRDCNPLAVWYVKTTVAQRGGRGEMYD